MGSTATLAAAITLDSSAFIAGLQRGLGGVKNFLATAGAGLSGLTAFSGIGAAIAASLAAVAAPAAVVASAFKNIGHAADMDSLARGLGDTVSNVYSLQKAFKLADGTEQGAVSALRAMQKALGGLNDEGEPTAGIFSQIGLSIEKLKVQAPADALLDVFDALKKVDNATQTAAAAKIFGRAGGTEAVTVMRDDTARQNFKAAKPEGDIFQRTSRAADALMKGFERLKNLGRSISLPMIEGMIPMLKAVVDWVEKIAPKMKAIGKTIGDALVAGVQAFREGSFAELIALTLRAGFDKGLVFAAESFQKFTVWISEAMTKAGEVMVKSVIPVIGAVFQELAGRIAQFTGFFLEQLASANDALTKIGAGFLPASTIESSKAVSEAIRNAAQLADFTAGNMFGQSADSLKGMAKMLAEIADTKAFKALLLGDGMAEKVLGEKLASLLAAFRRAFPDVIDNNPPKGIITHPQKREAPSALERIGAVFGGGGGFGTTTELSRQTAANTRQIAAAQPRIEKHLGAIAEKLGNISFTNV